MKRRRSSAGGQAGPAAPPWAVEVDLHLHTTASDGQLSPAELIEQVAGTSLRVIAITDHDSTEGIDEALAAAERHPHLTVIPGIELGTEEGESGVHLLGYFIDYRDSALQSTLREFRESRVTAAQNTVKQLQSLGLDVSWERVQELAHGAVGRPHVARAMIERGHVATMQEAFDVYLGDNGIARAPRHKQTPTDGLDLVHRAGGVGAVAHPRTVKDLHWIVGKLAQAGLAGIEVYAEKYGVAERAKYMRLAGRHGLVQCGGSDYHANGSEGEVLPGVSGPPPQTPQLLLDRAMAKHGRRPGYVPARPLHPAI